MRSHLVILARPTPGTSTYRPATFPFGRFELFSLGGRQIGRAVYAPSGRWSEHIAPLVGPTSWQVEHVGLVTAGQAAARMDDVTEVTMVAGDLFSIPSGHDSWVLGDQDYVSLHFFGAQHYVTPGPASDHG